MNRNAARSITIFCLLAGAAVVLPTLAMADDDAPSRAGIPTFAKDIAPILHSKCMECHRTGEIAPMALTSFEEARPYAKSIKTEVSAKRMPPWHADPVAGPYRDNPSLSDEQIKTIVAWVDGGAPLGNPKDMPKVPSFKSDWKAGTPDHVLKMPVQYTLGPEGPEIYRCFVMPETDEDTWVRGFEFKPGNRAIDHHVVLFLDKTGKQSPPLDEADPEPGYSCFGGPGFASVDIVGVWAPGGVPEMLPSGIARKLPKGSRLVMQTHYHRNGKTEKDLSEVGIYLAKGAVKQELHTAIAADPYIKIEAGAASYDSKAVWPFRSDVNVLSVFPHMHLLGKKIEMTAVLPDGSKQPLVSVSRYDFNWQRTYFFEKAVALPNGTRVEVTSHYDNSAENPNNPSKPPKPVRFGMSTTDEMNVGLMYYTIAGEDLTQQKPEAPAAGAGGS